MRTSAGAYQASFHGNVPLIWTSPVAGTQIRDVAESCADLITRARRPVIVWRLKIPPLVHPKHGSIDADTQFAPLDALRLIEERHFSLRDIGVYLDPERSEVDTAACRVIGLEPIVSLEQIQSWERVAQMARGRPVDDLIQSNGLHEVDDETRWTVATETSIAGGHRWVKVGQMGSQAPALSATSPEDPSAEDQDAERLIALVTRAIASGSRVLPSPWASHQVVSIDGAGPWQLAVWFGIMTDHRDIDLGRTKILAIDTPALTNPLVATLVDLVLRQGRKLNIAVLLPSLDATPLASVATTVVNTTLVRPEGATADAPSTPRWTVGDEAPMAWWPSDALGRGTGLRQGRLPVSARAVDGSPLQTTLT
jgi:hypothetical protein